MESEHSVLSAAIASQATGVRTFTASSSQGLMLMHEMHYVASGMRLPLVMVNCSRGLAAPITLWPDHNDIMALRSSGWIMLFAKNNQQVIDSVIQAYNIAEDKKVLVPVIINMDGFIQSFTNEPTEILSQNKVDKFLPKYNPSTYLDVKKPISLGVPVMEGYTEFRSQLHKAHLNALDVISQVGKDFKKSFGRSYGLIEKYKTSDAKIIFVGLGSLCTSIEKAVDSLRKQGIKAGILIIRSFRPFPRKEIESVLRDCNHIAVIDNNIAPGFGGMLYSDICTIVDRKKVANFIISLGGKHTSRKDFEDIARKTLKKKDLYWLL